MYEQLDLSQYFYGIRLEEADFMMNESHEIQYNDTCLECTNDCKQSYKCTIIECPRFRLQRKGRRRETKDR